MSRDKSSVSMNSTDEAPGRCKIECSLKGSTNNLSQSTAKVGGYHGSAKRKCIDGSNDSTNRLQKQPKAESELTDNITTEVAPSSSSSSSSSAATTTAAVKSGSLLCSQPCATIVASGGQQTAPSSEYAHTSDVAQQTLANVVVSANEVCNSGIMKPPDYFHAQPAAEQTASQTQTTTPNTDLKQQPDEKKVSPRPSTATMPSNSNINNNNSRIVMPTAAELRSPYLVQCSVKMLVHSWGPVAPVPPDYFLQRLLQSRGYDHIYIQAMGLRNERHASVKQIEDYDNELVWAIRNSDLPTIRALHGQGKSMSACNRFKESIVHMAARRAELDVVEFILDHGADLTIVDDYGRTPLHDACWRPEPRFDIVTLIMDRHLDLVRYSDKRGSIPLKYVREEHWVQWCAYLYHQREKYWPSMNTAAAAASNAQGHTTTTAATTSVPAPVTVAAVPTAPVCSSSSSGSTVVSSTTTADDSVDLQVRGININNNSTTATTNRMHISSNSSCGSGISSGSTDRTDHSHSTSDELFCNTHNVTTTNIHTKSDITTMEPKLAV